MFAADREIQRAYARRSSGNHQTPNRSTVSGGIRSTGSTLSIKDLTRLTSKIADLERDVQSNISTIDERIRQIESVPESIGTTITQGEIQDKLKAIQRMSKTFSDEYARIYPSLDAGRQAGLRVISDDVLQKLGSLQLRLISLIPHLSPEILLPNRQILYRIGFGGIHLTKLQAFQEISKVVSQTENIRAFEQYIRDSMDNRSPALPEFLRGFPDGSSKEFISLIKASAADYVLRSQTDGLKARLIKFNSLDLSDTTPDIIYSTTDIADLPDENDETWEDVSDSGLIQHSMVELMTVEPEDLMCLSHKPVHRHALDKHLDDHDSPDNITTQFDNLVTDFVQFTSLNYDPMNPRRDTQAKNSTDSANLRLVAFTQLVTDTDLLIQGIQREYSEAFGELQSQTNLQLQLLLEHLEIAKKMPEKIDMAQVYGLMDNMLTNCSKIIDMEERAEDQLGQLREILFEGRRETLSDPIPDEEVVPDKTPIPKQDMKNILRILLKEGRLASAISRTSIATCIEEDPRFKALNNAFVNELRSYNLTYGSLRTLRGYQESDFSLYQLLCRYLLEESRRHAVEIA